MAEFQEVMRQFNRMCEAHVRTRCAGCPLDIKDSIKIECGIDSFRNESEYIERKIMQWAAEHPEPVYPTWGEWLESIGVIKYNNRADSINYLILPTHKTDTQIPADIAQKLGLQPKEG